MFYVVLITIAVVFVGYLIYSRVNFLSKPKEEQERLKQEFEDRKPHNRDARFKQNFIDEIMEHGFRNYKYIELKKDRDMLENYNQENDFTSKIAFDNELKEFALYDFNKKTTKFYAYDKLIEFEVSENGGSVVKGRVGSAIVGALTFGAAGAVVGSSRSRGINDYVTDLVFTVRVSDFDSPSFSFILVNKKIAKNDAMYIAKMNTINEAISYFTLVKDYNENNIKNVL